MSAPRPRLPFSHYYYCSALLCPPSLSSPLPSLQLSGQLSTSIPNLFKDVNISSDSRSVLLRFVSDGGLQYAGIRLLVEVVPPLPPGIVLMCPTFSGSKTSNITVTPAVPLLVSTNLVPEYAPSVTCTLAVTLSPDVPPGWSIRIRPISIASDAGTDVLNVYEGRSSSSQLALTLSGTTVPAIYRDVNISVSRTALITFVSDAGTQSGGATLLVEAVPPLPAGMIMMCPTAPSTTRVGSAVITPGISYMIATNLMTEYAPGVSCTLTLTLDAPAGWMIRMRPLSVVTETNFDTLSVYDGANTSVPLALQVRSTHVELLPMILARGLRLLTCARSRASNICR